MHIEQNYPLQDKNTLAIPSFAEYFCCVHSLAEAQEALAWASANTQPVSVLGGGSNVILPEQVKGLVIQPKMSGITIKVQGDMALVTAGAGENWHQFVSHCTDNGYYGVENLALIPGDVGAAPIQNIGAYGVEFSHVFHELTALNLETARAETLSAEQCEFAYRDSVFKTRLRRHYMILSVTLKLSKIPEINIGYPALHAELERADISQPTPSDVMKAVVAIRQRKLPDPVHMPNAGSFFKNPVIELAKFDALKAKYPKLVSFDVDDNHKKLAAAWLIDALGWKGKAFEGVKVHPEHALVLTNPERCTADAVLSLAAAIQEDVDRTFGVELEVEPQVLGRVEG